MSATRVVLIDDHPVVREGLTISFEQTKDLVVCGEASDYYEALDVIEKLQPDVAVMDLSLQGMGGLDLIKTLRKKGHKLPILVLSIHNESFYAERAIRAGAQGYIMKQETTEEVIKAVRQILQGKIYVSRELSDSIMYRFFDKNPASNSPLDRLTDRELEVYQLIGQGVSPHKIADDLCISIKTVDSYRARIKEKLNLKSGTELLQSAIQWVQSQDLG